MSNDVVYCTPINTREQLSLSLTDFIFFGYTFTVGLLGHMLDLFNFYVGAHVHPEANSVCIYAYVHMCLHV